MSAWPSPTVRRSCTCRRPTSTRPRSSAPITPPTAPTRGDAGYDSLPALGFLGENAVWEYADPYPAVAEIRGTVAFYADRVEITES